MIQIPILNIPNQTLSVQLDNNQWDIVIYATQDNPDGTTGIMAVDVSINNVVIVSGSRAVSGFPIIGYDYLVNGNIIFTTLNNSYPDWRQFGITQYLIYASDLEMGEISNGTFTT
jgi:hypothetical protein